ncbi:MAG: methyltransferase [Candidatus Eremiobacterota bacterium]
MLSKEIYENIDKISSISRGFMQAQILITATELNLFTVIGEEGKKIEDILLITGTDKRATEILLNALTGMGLLYKKGDFYENSPLGKDHLIEGKEFYMGYSIKHGGDLYRRWAELPEIVRTGHPVTSGMEKRRKSPEETRRFIMAMANVGAFSVEELINANDFSGKKYFLDIGGGPGTYAIGLCSKYPDLKATVFDLPEVVSIAEEQIVKAGLSERINTLGGDYLKDPLDTGYDIILISNIIHSLGEHDILLLFDKARKSLSEGGEVIVKDFFPEDDRTGPEYPLVFAVNMLSGTKEGNTYTGKEITEWLKQSGFTEVEIKKLTPHTSIAIGK